MEYGGFAPQARNDAGWPGGFPFSGPFSRKRSGMPQDRGKELPFQSGENLLADLIDRTNPFDPNVFRGAFAADFGPFRVIGD